MPNALKAIAQWVTYGVLLVAAGAIILVNKADPAFVERLRLQASGAVTPILEVLASSIDALRGAFDQGRYWLQLSEDNAHLRADVARLSEWQSVAERLEAENAELRALLRYVPEPAARFVAARVVADTGGAFAHSLLLNAGSKQGIAKGHIVMTGEGLVGRIVGVAPRASRALVITDLNSRVPVLVGQHHVRAILAGDNTERPKLIHVEPGSAIQPGDRIVTSAITGAFPAGLPVGIVAETDRIEASVAPLFDRSRLGYVRIVDLAIMPELANEMKAAAGHERDGMRSSRGGQPIVEAE